MGTTQGDLKNQLEKHGELLQELKRYKSKDATQVEIYEYYIQGLKNDLQNMKSVMKSQDGKCYNCGKSGHKFIECNDQAGLAIRCECCHQFGHNGSECNKKSIQKRFKKKEQEKPKQISIEIRTSEYDKNQENEMINILRQDTAFASKNLESDSAINSELESWRVYQKFDICGLENLDYTKINFNLLNRTRDLLLNRCGFIDGD